MTVKHFGRGSGAGATTIGKPVVHPAAVDLRGKVYEYVKFHFIFFLFERFPMEGAI